MTAEPSQVSVGAATHNGASGPSITITITISAELLARAGTSADGVAFDRQRKPRGRPLLCTECAAEPAAQHPVFVRATYRRHEIARAASAQADIEIAARGGA